MSTTLSFTIELKSILASALAFGTILLLKQPTFSDTVSQFGEKQETVIIFLVLLLTQILFEMMYKYEGKLCELAEGIFTAIFAIIGYFVADLIATRVAKIEAPVQAGGALSPSLIGAIGAATGIWIWKRFIKYLILPTNCSPCTPLMCAPCAPCPAPVSK